MSDEDEVTINIPMTASEMEQIEVLFSYRDRFGWKTKDDMMRDN